MMIVFEFIRIDNSKAAVKYVSGNVWISNDICGTGDEIILFVIVFVILALLLFKFIRIRISSGVINMFENETEDDDGDNTFHSLYMTSNKYLDKLLLYKTDENEDGNWTNELEKLDEV